MLQLSREFARLTYFLKINVYNYNFLEQVKNLLFCELQLRTIEARNLNESNINLKNRIKQMELNMGNGEEGPFDADRLISENKKMKEEIRQCNVRLLKLNQKSIVG